jgi:predicted secreted protein
MINQKSGIIILGLVILMVTLTAGCLGTGQRHPEMDTAPVTCSVSLVSGQNMIVNETQNNATICARPNSSLTIRLVDTTMSGTTWKMNASPGLQIADHGLTWFREKGSLPTSSIEHGYDEWGVTTNETGIQTINANLRYLGEDMNSSLETYNLTIVVK